MPLLHFDRLAVHSHRPRDGEQPRVPQTGLAPGILQTVGLRGLGV